MKVTAPTIHELTLIAASLASHDDPTDDQRLASRAMVLWVACAREIDRAKQAAKQITLDDLPSSQPLFKSPKNFPVSFDDALRLWLPNVKEPDRNNAYREYLKWYCAIRNMYPGEFGQTSPLAWEEAFANRKAKPMDKEWFFENGRLFLEWRERNISKLRSISGAKGGRPPSAETASKEKSCR